MRIGFDNDKYLKMQSEYIKERINKFGNKLYLEFGGKLFDDFHASRVLPGFEPDSKLKMLLQLADQSEIVIVIAADSIEKNKKREDLGITYDKDVLRLIEEYRSCGLYVGSVVVTMFKGQSSALAFKDKLERQNIKVYMHYAIEGYPTNVAHIVSDEGFGKNDYIETSRPLVIITAPGPGSGKMATCLSQLYHENKRGIKAGYAKFETFPIWNIPLKHPVNLAYEAATADLNDVNMIDPFHLENYGTLAVNYNRDVEIFPVVKSMFEAIYGESIYKSPTDMGVNMVGFAISNEEKAKEASKNEIIRRYLDAIVDVRNGKTSHDTIDKIAILMGQLNISINDRKCVKKALDKRDLTNTVSMAMELNDGHIVTSKTSDLLSAPAALILNALKYLSNIPDDVVLISPAIIEPVSKMKIENLGNHNPRLHADEVLIALAISARTNPLAEMAMQKLPELASCQAHSTAILSQVDNYYYKKLKIDLTTEPEVFARKLYVK